MPIITGGVLGMELHAEEWFLLVNDALVGFVVEIGEQRLPVLANCCDIDSEAVVLGSHETPVGAVVDCRQVMATIAVLQLVSLTADSGRQ